MLTQEALKQTLEYDPEKGIFHWRVNRRRVKAGDRAGEFSSGYRRIKIDGRLYLEHRLAWLYVHGRWPTAMIDHRDGDRANNRLVNLREATHAENLRNRKDAHARSGVRGVYYRPKKRKWEACIYREGRVRHIGLYDSLLAAEVARGQAAAIFHGRFASY